MLSRLSHPRGTRDSRWDIGTPALVRTITMTVIRITRK